MGYYNSHWEVPAHDQMDPRHNFPQYYEALSQHNSVAQPIPLWLDTPLTP